MYIATERVRPLDGVLRDWASGGALAGSSSVKGKGKEDWIGWGIRSIAVSWVSSYIGSYSQLTRSVDCSSVPELPTSSVSSRLPPPIVDIRDSRYGMEAQRV